MTTRDVLRAELSRLLDDIRIADWQKDYGRRYTLVIRAMGVAAALGYEVGFDVDLRVQPPGFPIVAFIELPVYGQLSWHMPVHSKRWDGHSTDVKYARIMNYNIDTSRDD